MKTAHFFFGLGVFGTMIAALSLPAAMLKAQASPAPQQTVSRSSEKSAGRQGDQQKDAVRNNDDKDQADGNQKQSPGVTRTITEQHASVSRFKPVPTNRVRPTKMSTTNTPRSDVPASMTEAQHAGSNGGAGTAHKPVSHSAAPPSAVSVNGQQFRSSRDPGARLASSGGSLTSPRAAAALNGTNMRHKP
jgi:hypothetical protein